MRQIHFLITQKQQLYQQSACTREQRVAPGRAPAAAVSSHVAFPISWTSHESGLWKMIVIHSAAAGFMGCVSLCARAETAAENKKDELDNLVFSAATSVPWFGSFVLCCRIADPSTSLSLFAFIPLVSAKETAAVPRRTRARFCHLKLMEFSCTPLFKLSRNKTYFILWRRASLCL
jgi:hypothetical protein